MQYTKNMRHRLTHTITQVNPDGHDTSLEFTVWVDEDFNLDSIIEIRSFSLQHLHFTDITRCMMEHMEGAVIDLLSEVEWKQIYEENKSDNYLYEAV